MPSREPVVSLHIRPLFLLGLLPLALGACGEGGGFDLPVTTGTLEVTTVTTGDEMDPDGYAVQVDAEAPQPIGIAGRVQRTLFKPGNHTLRLDGLAPNCNLLGENPRTVVVVAGQTLTSTFEVTCTATSGGIVITTTTGGASPDPDGYSVVLDGVEQGPIPASGQVTLTGLVLGSHVVGLSGLAGNCLLEGENLRAVTVTPASSAPVDYAVTCAAPPPNAGTLRIVTATSGNAPAPAGYSFAMDGGPGQPIAANGTASIINVAPGSHQLHLSGLPDNCRVQGDNPRTVKVAAGGSTDASFAVVCTLALGSIRVSVSTSGRPADPDGYLAQLDNTAPGVRVVANGSVRFTDVPVGSHTITLTDVAPNCTVNGGPSQSAGVTTGGKAEVGFTVSCSAITSSIVVTTQTTGPSPDPDGYTVAVDGNERGSVLAIGEESVTVSAGSHEVELTGIAGNCEVQGENPRTITVTAGGSTPVQYSIVCVTPPAETGSLRITTATTGPNPDDNGYDVAVDDGSSQLIGTNDAITLSDISPGVHNVQLSGNEANCAVDGTNPQVVTVVANETSQVSFSVTCRATTGNIHVTVTTSGLQPDVDGYEVTLDPPGSGKSVASVGDQTFTDVPAGSHILVLSGLAENCSTQNASENVVVIANETVEVSFSIDCPAPPQETGSIEVHTNTPSNPPDGGYTVTLDSEDSKPLGANDEAIFEDVALGTHRVELVAGSCTVEGENPQEVDLTETGSTITFNVSCPAPAASLDVGVSISGDDLDEEYTVTLDETEPAKEVRPNERASFIDVVPGDHKVGLNDVAANCNVGGEGPSRNVSLSPGETRQVDFEVTCAPTGTGGNPPGTE